MTKCTHIYRSGQLHPSIVIGSVSLGRCTNEVFPELTVCYEHATKDAIALLANHNAKR